MRTTPTIMSRENLHPKWADLSQRTDQAREEFREGTIDEEMFRGRLKRLGFRWSEIQIEVAQNKPTVAVTSHQTQTEAGCSIAGQRDPDHEYEKMRDEG